MATCSSILAWKIPWKEEPEEPGGLQPWGHKELDMTEHTPKGATFTETQRRMVVPSG